MATAETGLTLWRVDGAPITLSVTGEAPVWSPDGRWLAYRDADRVWAEAAMVGETAVFRFNPPHPVPFGERLFTFTNGTTD